ncbi:ABC transporter substrate-binding protein [Actinokineospora iranica]|uniref:Peptide/nickel transport system substrate-binding protein n=1 Tax=Actinokineospora iranica TaxID=1271860 RepID=A0A1G6WB75_9PSEU|nr:ABC transporter substrate-binding protein [Actinokineospora iranica]SDD62306.1 peptide/nickel transport system substrate-binding protein [Actinokineospora iranica]
MSPTTIDRRRFLQLSALAAAVTGGGALTGCASRASGSGAGGTSTLRIGIADATKSTALDPRAIGYGASLMVLHHVYDSLMFIDNGKYALGLAESVTPNADATRWTIRIRPGVKFHSGRPVTAADVAYSLRTIGAPKSTRSSVYADVDGANIKVVDTNTVEVPLKRPRGDFREAILVIFSVVFPEGTTDFTKADGSGPYRLETNDGKNVVLLGNKDYWGQRPPLSRLDIVRMADAPARLNALKAGEIDYAVGISATGAQAERANSTLELRRGGAANSNGLSFSMNQRLKPFDDPRVRKAVRLAVDRAALVNNSLLGLGTPANDVIGLGLPGYADLPERTQDLDQARKLLGEAGISELTLRIAELVPGMVGAAQLFAQQLGQAGVKLNLQQVPADTYYADLKSLATVPFQGFYYLNRPAAVHLAAVTNSKAPFNVTGAGEDHHRRLTAAQQTVDDDKRAEQFAAIQRQFHAEGGDVVWGFQEQIDASRPGVRDVAMRDSLPLFMRASA